MQPCCESLKFASWGSIDHQSDLSLGMVVKFTMSNSRIGSAFTMIVLAICTSIHHVDGSGPTRLQLLPVWSFTMAQCEVFRNETALRPLFLLWPESNKRVPFRYCCEYENIVNPVTASSASFNLSGYRYGPGKGTLMPAPYFDLGMVDARYKWYWEHWIFWKLPMDFDTQPLYCEVSDLHRLYMSRFWWNSFVRGSETASVLLIVLGIVGIAVPLCRRRRVRWEELWSDVLHVVLLSTVGSSLMEAIGHSAMREWRAQVMYNSAVVYTYLTLFAMMSSVVRHSIRRRSLKLNRKHAKESWRWQKVFGQFAAQFVLGGYLILVEDVSGRRLEGWANLVFGTLIGATIYSAGVELYVISQFFRSDTIVEKTKGDSDSGSDSCDSPV